MPSQALRVPVVLLLASTRVGTLGRTLVILATALSIEVLLVALLLALVLKTLRVPLVLLLARPAIGATSRAVVVVATALSPFGLERLVGGHGTVGLRWAGADRCGALAWVC